MAEKNIILHWSRGYHEIFQNSIFLAYVPKKNISIAPWYNQIKFYIVSRTACLEMNKFLCIAILDFCQKLKISSSRSIKWYPFR